MSRHEWPEDPVHHHCGNDADHEGDTTGRGDVDDRGFDIVGLDAERDHDKGDAADDSGARVWALGEAAEHGDHVDGGKEGHDVGVAVICSVCDSSPTDFELVVTLWMIRYV